ncbi:MAG: ABC transporter substrate-binding protein, partial [Anaerolineae bacterium]
RHLRSVLALVVLVGLFTACQAGGGTGAEPELLRVWITWGDNPAQIQELFNGYTEETGIRVEVNSPVEDDKVIAALSGTEPPDILVLGGPDSVATWVNEGLVTPLDEYIAEKDIDIDDIYPAMLDQGRYQGELYALPWGSDTYGFYWNKDLFEQAGLDPERPPETMEELLDYAEQLTLVDENGRITQLGFVPDFSWSHMEQYIKLFGSYWFNDDGTKVQLDTPEMAAALRWEREFYSRFGADEVLRFVSSTGEYDSAQHGFMAGKIAMMVDGEWMVGDNFIGGLAPDLWYGVGPIPYPAGHPERKGTNTVGGTVALIPSGVANKDAAADLLAWMMTPEIVAEEMVANFNLPSSTEAAEDPRFYENEKFVVFMDLASSPNATSQIFTPISSELLSELDLIEQQVLHQGADPEPLLAEAQTKLQTMLDDVLGE